MFMLSTGEKGEHCYECIGSGPPGPPGPRGLPGNPGKTIHCRKTHGFYQLQSYVLIQHQFYWEYW